MIYLLKRWRVFRRAYNRRILEHERWQSYARRDGEARRETTEPPNYTPRTSRPEVDRG